jgi:hypothetical protein
MPGLALQIDYTAPPGMTARKWSDFCKHANQEVGEYWNTHYKPKHFEAYAARRYRYSRRSTKYQAQKEKQAARGSRVLVADAGKYRETGQYEGRDTVKLGGRRDLVRSGLLMEQILRRPIMRIYPTRFTITMPTSRPRRPRLSRIDLHEEITRVIDEERTGLSAKWRVEIQIQQSRYKPRRRVRI